MNVVLFVIDTLRADHLGCYGYFRDTSPTIDKLASEGVRFNVEPAAANFPSNCVVDELRLSDHQKEVNELILDPEDPFSVEYRGKAAMTWGGIKSLY